MENQNQSRNTIIGIPPELYLKAKSEAALQGKTLGQYVSEALAEKIHIHDAGKRGSESQNKTDE